MHGQQNVKICYVCCFDIFASQIRYTVKLDTAWIYYLARLTSDEVIIYFTVKSQLLFISIRDVWCVVTWTYHNLILVWPCVINKDGKEESQLDATITVYWQIQISSTCFGQQFCPSSAALDCTYRLWCVVQICYQVVIWWQRNCSSCHQITDRQRIGYNIPQAKLLPGTCRANFHLSINCYCCI